MHFSTLAVISILSTLALAATPPAAPIVPAAAPPVVPAKAAVAPAAPAANDPAAQKLLAAANAGTTPGTPVTPFRPIVRKAYVLVDTHAPSGFVSVPTNNTVFPQGATDLAITFNSVVSTYAHTVAINITLIGTATNSGKKVVIVKSLNNTLAVPGLDAAITTDTSMNYTAKIDLVKWCGTWSKLKFSSPKFFLHFNLIFFHSFALFPSDLMVGESQNYYENVYGFNTAPVSLTFTC